MTWRATLTVPDGDAPVFVRVAEAVVEEIRRGRLRPGDALPGTRRVALQLGLHRNTVLAAWSELRAQGWIEARPGGATTVSSVPRPVAQGVPRPAGAGFDVAPCGPTPLGPEWPPGTLVMAGGRPDLRSVPTAELARAWRTAVRQPRGRLLAYGDPRGLDRLRAALAGMLSAERGLVPDGDGLMITRGSQQALSLVAQALLRPGDRVAVEALGYPAAWAAFRAHGAHLVPIDVDTHGVRVDAIEHAARSGGLRAIYVTPHHQFPTMVTLPAERRLRLLELAARHRIAVIEDDYDHEFHFRGRPVLPLAARDPAGVVVYVGTLSKTLAPGLRLGFVAAPPPLMRALVAARIAADRQGDHVLEHALATLIEDGTVARHLRRMRRVYAARQARLAGLLTEHLADQVTFDVPAGGLALWVRASHADADAWAGGAARRGVGIEAGGRFHLHGGPLPFLRAGFAALDDDELERAVRTLADVVRVTPGPRGR